MTDRVWTSIEILNSARQYLEGKGIENPRGSAEALLGKVLDLPRIQLYVQHDRPLSAPQVAAFRELIRRRAQHEPLQLLLGQLEFLDCRLEVVPGLLIPRPETEELAQRVIDKLKCTNGAAPRRLLDIGSGTGCLAVAVTRSVSNLSTDAVDLDYEAVRCTGRNARQNDVAARVRTLRADLFSPRFLDLVKPPYDAVVSNPPYIAESDYASLQTEVREYEPRHALVAPQQGLAFYHRIAELLPTLLRPTGFVAVEIGQGQDTAVTDSFKQILEAVEVFPDLAGIPRIVIGQGVRASWTNTVS